LTVELLGRHPNPRVSPEKAAGVVGVSGDTLRRTYARDPKSVPYIYKAGRRIFVSIPLVHEHLHGLGTSWTDCPVCWQVGPDPFDDELTAEAQPVEESESSSPDPSAQGAASSLGSVADPHAPLVHLPATGSGGDHS
jgi:hypothetical protein